MKFRNKVLPVLLAAGMLATMPATTAVNVLADAKFYAVKNEDTSPKELTDGTVSYSRDITTGANCTTDGTVTITATYTNGKDVITATKTYTIKAYGHDYNFTGGTWTWTPTGKKNADGSDEYTATYTYSCNRDDDKQTVNATVEEAFEGDEGNKYPSCTYAATVDYDASVKIGDKTYYPEKEATVVYKKNEKDKYLDADGKVTTDKTKYVDTGVRTSKGATETDNGNADFKTTFTRGHEWSVTEWDWNANSKYIDTKTKKDNYLTKAAEAVEYKTGKDDKGKSYSYLDDSALSDHYSEAATGGNKDNTTDYGNIVEVKVHCNSIYHTVRGQSNDGPKDNYVPAWVYVDQNDATCTTDATTTYYAYVFSNADDVTAQVTALGTKLGWDKDTIKSEIADAKSFFTACQLDNNGKGYGSFAETKTDTWEGSATGHDYYNSGWRWSKDFSYVTLNLTCYKDDYAITVQSSQVTKNANGTAKVVYTAKDARKNNTPWYGKDGYYLDQSRNPYGKEFTLNALPLKNAGDVNNGKIVMTRLFNKTTGEHLYTSDANEIKTLVNEYNWTNEGVAWNAPAVSNTPVYRLFNRVDGQHFYTKDLNEVNNISKLDDWKYEGIAWYSDDNKTVPVYRQFDPKAATSKASHNYTTSTHEKKVLTTQHGWNDEGIAWYGV